jgi:hypothetical protein
MRLNPTLLGFVRLDVFRSLGHSQSNVRSDV